MDEKPGCLSGLLKLFLANALFDFLQEKFGFGRGFSCAGCGCGLILLIISISITCAIVFNTDWLNIGF